MRKMLLFFILVTALILSETTVHATGYTTMHEVKNGDVVPINKILQWNEHVLGFLKYTSTQWEYITITPQEGLSKVPIGTAQIKIIGECGEGIKLYHVNIFILSAKNYNNPILQFYKGTDYRTPMKEYNIKFLTNINFEKVEGTVCATSEKEAILNLMYLKRFTSSYTILHNNIIARISTPSSTTLKSGHSSLVTIFNIPQGAYDDNIKTTLHYYSPFGPTLATVLQDPLTIQRGEIIMDGNTEQFKDLIINYACLMPKMDETGGVTGFTKVKCKANKDALGYLVSNIEASLDTNKVDTVFKNFFNKANIEIEDEDYKDGTPLMLRIACYTPKDMRRVTVIAIPFIKENYVYYYGYHTLIKKGIPTFTETKFQTLPETITVDEGNTKGIYILTGVDTQGIEPKETASVTYGAGFVKITINKNTIIDPYSLINKNRVKDIIPPNKIKIVNTDKPLNIIIKGQYPIQINGNHLQINTVFQSLSKELHQGKYYLLQDNQEGKIIINEYNTLEECVETNKLSYSDVIIQPLPNNKLLIIGGFREGELKHSGPTNLIFHYLGNIEYGDTSLVLVSDQDGNIIVFTSDLKQTIKLEKMKEEYLMVKKGILYKKTLKETGRFTHSTSFEDIKADVIENSDLPVVIMASMDINKWGIHPISSNIQLTFNFDKKYAEHLILLEYPELKEYLGEHSIYTLINPNNQNNNNIQNNDNTGNDEDIEPEIPETPTDDEEPEISDMLDETHPGETITYQQLLKIIEDSKEVIYLKKFMKYGYITYYPMIKSYRMDKQQLTQDLTLLIQFYATQPKEEVTITKVLLSTKTGVYILASNTPITLAPNTQQVLKATILLKIKNLPEANIDYKQVMDTMKGKYRELKQEYYKSKDKELLKEIKKATYTYYMMKYGMYGYYANIYLITKDGRIIWGLIYAPAYKYY